MNSILIIEDDPVIAEDISLILEKKGYRISGIGHDSTKAIDLLANREFDLALLDIDLGSGQTGIDVAKIIKEKYFKPFIFLTSFSDDVTIKAAQEKAPFGYLVKPFQEATLLSSIAIALHNHQLLLSHEKSKKKEIDFSGHSEKLTEREEKICVHLCRGLTYQEISEAEFVSINTTRFHIKNLYLKFSVNSRSELVAKLLNA